MAKFNPAMLVPAQQAPEFNKGAGARSIKDVVLANISKMKEQFAAGDAAEGKVNFKIAGEKVAFAIRVSNTALVLGQFEDNGVTADVREMTVPKANFVEALDYYADRVKVGEFDAQIAGLSERKEARTEKLRNTRAAKKAEKEAKPA